MTRPTIYIVSDGKPGHLAQSRGLAQAIARLTPAQITEINVDAPAAEPDAHGDGPGLVIAAGHRAYAAAARYRRQQRLPGIALMNPGWLLRRRFDLCIIPRHDGIAASNRVILTEGAINNITPATSASPNEALLLIGGPSKHHLWEDESILSQLHTLLGRDKAMRWTATSSRRTPHATDHMLQELAQEHGQRFVYTPAEKTPPGWVAEQLERCGVCWVSEDSVSMVYESLSAGARVGLLEVPRKKHKPGRVVSGVLSLVDRGWVTLFHDWREGKALVQDRPPLAEADRVAKLVLERFPTLAQ